MYMDIKTATEARKSYLLTCKRDGNLLNFQMKFMTVLVMKDFESAEFVGWGTSFGFLGNCYANFYCL